MNQHIYIFIITTVLQFKDVVRNTLLFSIEMIDFRLKMLCVKKQPFDLINELGSLQN